MDRWQREDEPPPLFSNQEIWEAMLRAAEPPAKKEPTGIPDEGSLKVFYEFSGEFPLWQDDPDSPLMYREDPLPWDRHPLLNWPVRRTMRPYHSRQRAKKFTTWTEDGQPVGKWEWIYKDTP